MTIEQGLIIGKNYHENLGLIIGKDYEMLKPIANDSI